MEVKIGPESLKESEQKILRNLWSVFDGKSNSTDLREFSGYTTDVFSNAKKNLAQRGYIEIYPSEKDARKKIIELTEKVFEDWQFFKFGVKKQDELISRLRTKMKFPDSREEEKEWKEQGYDIPRVIEPDFDFEKVCKELGASLLFGFSKISQSYQEKTKELDEVEDGEKIRFESLRTEDLKENLITGLLFDYVSTNGKVLGRDYENILQRLRNLGVDLEKIWEEAGDRNEAGER